MGLSINKISFKKWCMDNLSKKEANNILDRWDYELNNKKPDEIGYSSKGENNKGYWFKCLEHLEHGSELKNIKNFVYGHKKSIDCYQCNSFAQWGIDNICSDFLEKYWDYNKNDKLELNPWEISKCVYKEVWIFCKNKDKPHHGSYIIGCGYFVKGRRCPYCSHRGGKTHPLDSFGQYIIDNHGVKFLIDIWSDKNKVSPFEYAPGSNYKVWWKCLDNKHDDYLREISSSNRFEYRCPDCVQERNESLLEEKTRLYLNELGYDILHERHCTIIPKNPKTKMPLPFDNEININGIKLILEVHGIQHYKLCGFHILASKHNNTTPEYEFHMQKVRDKYKSYVAYRNGYKYIAIPYTSDNKKEKYKTLIDNKIKKIQNK